MPLNKLENFIKNTDGRILYVNPNDLDATDSIENQGNSLTKPFKSIQRALIESARFSYLRGNNNDLVEKTTILLFPGEYLIDNRPGFAIKNVAGSAVAVSPSGFEQNAQIALTLSSESSFDLTDENNILYKFNSIYGGVIVPRGTSIVGLDLRKTKLRPKYVPNPTDTDAPQSSIFKITGACYFWQFSIFDAEETASVYTNPRDFSENNQSIPTFSHHKLTCFEYADGVTRLPEYSNLTDLDIYYSKLSNAYNVASARNIDQKYPSLPLGFTKQRPEYEIVGAFSPDPVRITKIISGDGFTPSPLVTVTTDGDHNLTAGTPIKIRGVGTEAYNISTKVQNVRESNQFTYLLSEVAIDLNAAPEPRSPSGPATVTIETDTVSGASPYVFNISLRSVWGMNGMHADGSKATGFRSMVVAQFTAVSLQKDDRAFVKYDKTSKKYNGIRIEKVNGSTLSSKSSSTSTNQVYHLDPEAIYRTGWKPVHIKVTNDAFIQVVSVFAIGFNKHFSTESGGDASITNSNSNFGQFSLASDGFKKEAFTKDDKGYVTAIIPPKEIIAQDSNIDWVSLDVGVTTSVGISSHLYLFGYTAKDQHPPTLIQGYRIGAKQNDLLYVNIGTGVSKASIYMNNEIIGIGNTVSKGSFSFEKRYRVLDPTPDNPNPSADGTITFDSQHDLQTGEKIRITSDVGDLPENITEHTLYYAIRVNNSAIKIASSKTNADNQVGLLIYGGKKLAVYSSVSDKLSGDVGHPIQYDTVRNHWYIHTDTNSEIYRALRTRGVANLTERTNVTYVKRFNDNRSLDEKLYKLQIVVPKEAPNSKDPTDGFVIQESSSTGTRSNLDFTATEITGNDHDFNRNPRFISSCTASGTVVTVTTELPHDLKVGNIIITERIKSTTNPTAEDNFGFNGTFVVTEVLNDKTFRHRTTDVKQVVHDVGTFTNNTNIRDINLPRFKRNDINENYYVYRGNVITPYIYNVQDGVYQLYVLNSGNAVEDDSGNNEFTDLKYSQNINDLYPQDDRDNPDSNPNSTKSYAKRSPLGAVVTNDLKNSITRETVDKFVVDFAVANPISGFTTSQPASGIGTITLTREHGLSGIVTYSSFAGGNGFTNGTYYNVKLLNNGTTTWDGATAKVVISSGSIVDVDITSGGSGYFAGEELDFDPSLIGPGVGAGLTISLLGISTAVGDAVYVSGIGTTSSNYYRIASIPAKNQIAIFHNVNSDAKIIPGQYALRSGPSIQVNTTTYDSTTGITTFTTSSPHGLLFGNSFEIFNSSSFSLGNFIVKERISTTQFTSITGTQLTSPKYVARTFLNANDGSASTDFGSRSVTVYDGEFLTLLSAVSDGSSIQVVCNTGISTEKRIPLGSYLQIDNEIMRVVSSTLSGAGNNQLSVIRGVLGTSKEDHDSGSLVKKIRPIPIEFRRPSIIRASGHTFEYLGYGPGNYSTGLPQVQVRTLSEKEAYLAQSQETAAGNISYTGMDSNGDFFIGNTKYSSTSGTQKNFDIPTPTVTGQDTTRLSVVFDEVLVKERIKVEGGSSNTALSQFDGPVTFNNELKMNGTVNITALLKETNETESTSFNNGSAVFSGGVGIAKNTNIAGNLVVTKNTDINGTLNVTGVTTVTSVNVTGRITPSAGSAAGNGIEWASDIWGGSGDRAFIKYYSESGENTRLHIGIQNDADDDLYLEASTTLVSGDLNVVGDITAFWTTSDINFKDNIKRIEDPLAKVLSISGNTFTWKDGNANTGDDTGLIAQEIEELGLPGIVKVHEDGHKAVQYHKIVPLLVEAIKELSQKVSDLENKLSK